jgi:hypothetical protein
LEVIWSDFEFGFKFESLIQNLSVFCRLTADRPLSDGGPSARRGLCCASADSASELLGRTVRTISGGQSAPGLGLLCKKIVLLLTDDFLC